MELLWLTKHPEYEKRPVDIRTFITSPEYLNCGEDCWASIVDDLESLFNGDYDEAVLCEAIGSGKSFSASLIIVYMVYKILCLKDPQSYFKFAAGSRIYFINMSIGAEQSKKVVFGEIKGRIDNSPWFQKNYPPDPSINSELRFAKGIVIFPGNSKETTPLGFNVFGAVMDEAAYYTDTPDHDVAEDMFNALHSRVKSRFGDEGKVIMISSPRYEADFVERKMKEALTNPKIFSRRKMLWEAKPLDRFSGEWVDFQGYKIPAECKILAERNPEVFKRDYMAIPSLVLEPYFKQWKLVELAIDPNLKSPLTPEGKIRIDLKPKKDKEYFIHIDLSLVSDCTGVAMCHEEDGKVVLDLAMQIKPPQGREIDLAEIRGIVTGLKTLGFCIKKVTYDSFQSASSIQELNKQGFNAEQFSLDRDLKGYETLKNLINEGKFKMYRYDPLLEELRRLELIEGKKVDHPKVHGGSKDVSDAVAGAVYQCVSNRNNIQFWFANSTNRAKTEEEIKVESQALTADGLCYYGQYGWNRRS